MITLFTIIVCFAVHSVSMKEFRENKHNQSHVNQLNDSYTHINGVNLEPVKCSIHCVLCERDGECSKCEVGYYDPTCSLKCLVDCGPRGCKQNTGTCNGKYISTTQPSFTSEGETSVPTTTPFKHTSQGKQGKCSIHCALCERGGKCVECEVGYYGPTCSLKCLVDCGLKGCKQNTGTCDETSIPTTTLHPHTSGRVTSIPKTTTTLQTSHNKLNIFDFLIGIAVGFVLVSIVAVTFMCYRRRIDTYKNL